MAAQDRNLLLRTPLKALVTRNIIEQQLIQILVVKWTRLSIGGATHPDSGFQSGVRAISIKTTDILRFSLLASIKGTDVDFITHGNSQIVLDCLDDVTS